MTAAQFFLSSRQRGAAMQSAAWQKKIAPSPSFGEPPKEGDGADQRRRSRFPRRFIVSKRNTACQMVQCSTGMK